jgi:hypothetical protein
MPVYNGHSLITQNARIPTAKQPNRPISNEGIKVQDSYLSQGNNTIRIANRHIVITTIKQSLKFDLTVTCFDISLVSKILFVCAGKLVYVFNCETNILKNQMGKVGGAVHKTDIRNCALDITGTLGVTCGDDKRIIIWDLVKYKALKYLLLM